MTMSDSKRSDEANEDLLAYITEPRLRPYLQTGLRVKKCVRNRGFSRIDL